MAKPVHTDIFYAEGRGPELQRIYWDAGGRRLQAIEYFNPDDVFDSASLKHVRFEGLQVVMITPEEVIRDHQVRSHPAQTSSAAMFDLERSEWLQSFSQHHLASCSHFQLLFYDELFDIICERVSCHRGRFKGEGTD